MSTEINIRKRIDIQEEGVSITPDVSSINFTGAGVTASAVGQDVTVDITAAAGSITYYMNQTVAQAPYQEFSSTGTAAAEQIVPATVAGGATVTIAAFQTASGVPNTTVIPQGLWQFFLHFNATTAGQNWVIRPYVYKRDLGGIETLIFTPDPEIVTNMSTTTTMYTCDGVIPNTTLLTTDRIVVKIDIENTTGVSQTVNFRTEGSQHYSVAATTLNQAVPTGAVTSVTGTAPVVSSGGTTPAISMPQANGTTDGYLDSADWTTFNNKVDDNIYTADGTLGGNRIVTMNSNTLLFDGTNSDVKYTPNSGGGYLQLEGKASGVPRFSVSIPPYLTKPLTGFQLGMRAWDDPSFPGYGKVGDAFFYAGSETNGLNFMNPVGTGTEDYIRFYAGNNASATSDIHIQGTGATRGNIGIGTETPTEKLDVNGKTKTTTFQMTTTPTAGYVLTSDASGNGTWSAAAGGLTYFTEAQSTAAPNATVPVDSLTAVSATTNADIAIVPKGTGAFMLDIPDNTAAGGNKRGANAVDLQTDRSNANQVASGQWSFAAGRSNRASADYAIALGVETVTTGGLGALSVGYGSSATATNSLSLGYYNTAGASASVALGYNNTASGANSFAVGQQNVASGAQSVAMGNTNVANADNSMATGYYSHTFGLRGRWVTGQVNSVPGDCQKSIFCLSIRTTGNTATTLVSGFGAGSPSATNQVILSNNSAYRFKGSIVGKQSGSVNAAVWDIDGFIVRGANAAATTLNISNVTLVQNTPAWGTPTLAADTTNGGLQVQVTGATATNIQWTAVIETTEVIYA